MTGTSHPAGVQHRRFRLSPFGSQAGASSVFALPALIVALAALVVLGCVGPTSVTAADRAAPPAASADPAPSDPAPADPAPTDPEPGGAAAPSSGGEELEAPEPSTPDPSTLEPSTTAPSTGERLAAADTELPRAAIGLDALDEFAASAEQPLPVAMTIDAIDVSDADIIAVGVNPQDQSFEVPPADQVGWYEFGPAPGEAGSSVLAAHIAYNGVDGVFRYLADVEVGAVVTIGFDDGTEQRYRITEVVEYVKEALPDSLFARTGEPQLALITCGGEFNDQLDSYDSNTVAIAVPIT